MTVHAAKGLEWDAVFLIGCEEGSFPHPASPVEEERRLFYVGMTRTRYHLFLANAETRHLHGERTSRQRSPFIQDIDQRLLQRNTPSHYKRRPRVTQLALTELLGE